MNDNDLTANSIKRLLNQSVSEISTETIASLRVARTRALERHRALQHAPVLAWLNHHGLWVGSSSTSQRNFNWAIALMLLAFLFSGAAYLQQTNEHEHSEIDIAILADDLPMDAYVEQ